MEQIQILEHRGIRVVTTKQIAEMYGTTTKRISNNFNTNKNRYKEGKHYFSLRDKEKTQFLNRPEIEDSYFNRPEIRDSLKKAKVLYLWTERGALLLAKSINTDVAWDAYERLVDFYFEKKEENSVPAERAQKKPPKNKYQTTSTPVPKNPSWHVRNGRRLNALCEKTNVTLDSVYHYILSRLGEEYDLNAANRIYEYELGKHPESSIDIVSYFPQLARMADDFLGEIEEIIG